MCLIVLNPKVLSTLIYMIFSFRLKHKKHPLRLLAKINIFLYIFFKYIHEEEVKKTRSFTQVKTFFEW